VDHFPPAFPGWLAGVLGTWLVLGAGVYYCLARLGAMGGGKVSAREFGQPDLLLCVGFIVWFGLSIASGFRGPEHSVTQKDLIHGALLFLGIVILIAMFMRFRGINPIGQFGLLRRNPLLCAALAAGLLLAAYPLVLLAAKLTDYALNGKERPENIVQYFLNASKGSDTRAIFLTMLMAVVVAPASEETIFRGYIYGVLKRYMGGVGAAVISAGLFAAMHLSVSSLPALFVLALCLTLAYEATGSLLVNIFMHGLFNLWNLLVMLKLAGHLGSP
jgi:membrane protease YdiL (CAAX protease family)